MDEIEIDGNRRVNRVAIRARLRALSAARRQRLRDGQAVAAGR